MLHHPAPPPEACPPAAPVPPSLRRGRKGLAAVGGPLAAFFLTGAVWAAVLILFQIAPFGERSLLITDLAQQYIEYHTALYDAVWGGGSLLYTWNGGLGMNFVGLFAYYLASPFTGLILFFPRALLPEAVLLILSLKLCGSALTMAVFLRQGAGVRGPAGPLFSAFYALSGYTAAFFFNLMWFDAVLLLPLVLLGVRHLADTGRIAPLAAAYTVLFLSNYYTAYMAGVFSLLFLLALCYTRGESLRDGLRRVLRLAGSAAIAAGLGAFLLLPAYLALRESQGGAGLALGGLSLAVDPLTLLSKFSFGAYDSVTGTGTPNLYCGILVMGLLPACLLHRGIPRREKIAGGALAGLLLLCMMVTPLNILWHGGQPPVWFPGRYAFCLLFLLVTAAARAFSRPQGLERWHILAGFGFSAVLMLAAKLPDWLFPEMAVPFPGRLAATLLLLALYAALLLLYKGKRRFVKNAALALLSLAVPLELAGNTLDVLHSLDEELGFQARSTFASYLEKTEKQAGQVAALAREEGAAGTFYRVEDRTPYNPNDGLVRGLPALSHYSSLSRRETFRFLKNLGLTVSSGDKLLRYGGSTSALDAILGVRAVFAPQELRPGMQPAGWGSGLSEALWINRNALPLAYFADKAVLSLPAEAKEGPFALQNALFAGLGGEAWKDALFYRPLSAEIRCVGGAMTPLKEPESSSAPLTTAVSVAEDGARLEIAIENPDRQHVLLYLANTLPENSPVYVNDWPLNGYGEWIVRGVMDLGEQPAGTVKVSIPLPESGGEIGEVWAAGFDQSLFDSLIAALRQGTPSQLEVTGTEVSAEITAPRDGLLFTSISCDEGWTAWVDGEPAAVENVAEAFLCIPVSEGTHQVTLRFFPKGLAAGAAVSGLTALLCAAAALWRRRQKKRAPADSDIPSADFPGGQR